MIYTDNPEADAENYYSECQKWIEKRPVCGECNHHIRDEVCYVFDDEIICSECVKDNHRKWTDDFVE